ncbi:MAG: DUF2834 domain-containing protein [Alphaproteobacteria bacterium]|nr:DUF2834 domain-containing protein [Alphaproteobacteria bacterium]
MARLVVYLVVLISFTVYSSYVTFQEGYWGFLHLALRERWAMQVLLDLCIALTLLWGPMKRDAQKHGINFWPYLLATPLLGSIAPLAYMVHRRWRRVRAGEG